jgi:hypothetical protein
MVVSIKADNFCVKFFTTLALQFYIYDLTDKYCTQNMMQFKSKVFFCTRPFRGKCDTWHRNVEIFPGV